MKIYIDNELIFEASETEENVARYIVPCYREWIKEGVVNIMRGKIKSAMAQLQKEWVTGGKLAANGITSIPIDDIELAQLIFAQTDPNKPHVYRNRNARDTESV